MGQLPFQPWNPSFACVVGVHDVITGQVPSKSVKGCSSYSGPIIGVSRWPRLSPLQQFSTTVLTVINLSKSSHVLCNVYFLIFHHQQRKQVTSLRSHAAFVLYHRASTSRLLVARIADKATWSFARFIILLEIRVYVQAILVATCVIRLFRAPGYLTVLRVHGKLYPIVTSASG